MRLDNAAAIAWKDALDFIRDRKSIGLMVLSAFLFPLLGALVTGLSQQQRALVVVVACDSGPHVEQFTRLVLDSLGKLGWAVVKAERSASCKPVPGAALVVAIPRGFESNATSLSKPVTVKVYKLVGSAAADQLEARVYNVISLFSEQLARERVLKLAEMAGVAVDPAYVLHPARLVAESVSAGGAPVPRGLEERVRTARFLSFAVFFILNPAAIAVADSVARERESGTGEVIAVTPVTGSEFVLGKAMGSMVAALVAGSVDALAVLLYTGLAMGGLDPGLLAVHVVETVLAIFATAAATVLATLLLPGQRTASLVTSLITGVAVLVFFTALFVDFERLPLPVRLPLYLVPYTYTVEAIKSYAVGNGLATAAYTFAQLAASVASLALASRVYKPSRIVKRG